MSQLQPGRGRGHQRNRFNSAAKSAALKPKAFKSPITEIANDTFNTGESKFTAQFNQSRDNVVRYLQRQCRIDEGYRVALTVKTGQVQTIPLPPPLSAVAEGNAADPDGVLLRTINIRSVGKQRI